MSIPPVLSSHICDTEPVISRILSHTSQEQDEQELSAEDLRVATACVPNGRWHSSQLYLPGTEEFRTTNHAPEGLYRFGKGTLISMEPTEVGQNSCGVHVGVLAYIIVFIALLPFSWGPG